VRGYERGYQCIDEMSDNHVDAAGVNSSLASRETNGGSCCYTAAYRRGGGRLRRVWMWPIYELARSGVCIVGAGAGHTLLSSPMFINLVQSP
jgi:hypothetical protein